MCVQLSMSTCMRQDGLKVLEHWAEPSVKLTQALKFGALYKP